MIQNKRKEVTGKLKTSSEDIVFESQYAPMVIREMTCDEIIHAAQEIQVSSIDVFYTPEAMDPSLYYIQWYPLEEMKKINGYTALYQKTGLTGKGVTLGILEHMVPYEVSRWELDYYPDWILDMIKIENVGLSPISDWHGLNSALIIGGTKGIAPGLQWVYYAALEDDGYPEPVRFYYALENLVNKGVNVINGSINIGYRGTEGDVNKIDYKNYKASEKWLDYMAYAYNLTFVQSAGNDALNTSEFFYPILTLGLCYNTITVGGLDDKSTAAQTDDTVWEESSYVHLDGCYKPDLIVSKNVGGGGTSSAAPVVTGTIALLLELKPSLAVYPQVIKAILLASCHRKAKDPVTNTQTEYMHQGLTNKQGAGVLDPFIAVSIVGNGQYGLSEVNEDADRIRFVQPRYESTHMNMSIAWQQNNSCSSTDYPAHPIHVGLIQDIDLEVYNDYSYIGGSGKPNSSTEMAYVALSTTSDNYSFLVSKYHPNAARVPYGYAWSTNVMKYQTPTLEGIYYLRNKNSGRYLDVDAVGTGNICQYTFHGGANQQWVVYNPGTNGYQMKTNFSGTPGGLTRGIAIDSNATYAAVKETGNLYLQMKENNDGTYRVLHLNTSAGRWEALDVRGGSVQSGAELIWYWDVGSDNQKWYFERVNYRKGDVNLDGQLNSSDLVELQHHIAGSKKFTEVQKFLADVNGDGMISRSDTEKLELILSGME